MSVSPRVPGAGRSARIARVGAIAAVVVLLTAAPGARADAWLFAPTLSLDQRVDDNYRLVPGGSDAVSATRLGAELAISRESRTASYGATLGIDGIYEVNDERDNAVATTQTADLAAEWRRRRMRYGLELGFIRDRLGFDIASNVADPANAAVDTGADLDQESEVDRQRYAVAPYWEYDLSRRSVLDARLRAVGARHELTDPDDALVDRYLRLLGLPEESRPQGFDPDIPLDQLTFDDVPTPFVVEDELDDYREWRLDLGWTWLWSPITSLRLGIGYSDYASDTEPLDNVIVPFEALEPDPDQRFVLRAPTRESLSETATLRLGLEHRLSRIMTLSGEIGAFRTEIDDSDLLRPGEPTNLPDAEAEQALRDGLVYTEDGWLAALGFTWDLDEQRFEARLGLDVEPSSIGSQVEALDLQAEWRRRLDPRLEFRLRGRAYEPDAIDANREDRYARRFISVEPRLTWQYSRSVTLAGAYRYRRQRAPTDTSTGESNALLFSIVYSPPSALADAVAAGSGR